MVGFTLLEYLFNNEKVRNIQQPAPSFFSADMKYPITVAGITISLDLCSEKTARYFTGFSADGKKEEISLPSIEKENILKEAERLNSDPSFGEYSLLLEEVANPVLRHRRFFFHGAAFLWQGKAWLFTGKSGTGKTTQLNQWLSLYPEETEIINGDKPIIEKKDNSFIVHPSPWTGKEGYKGNGSAQLGGIILLEQGDHNEFLLLKKTEAAFPLYLQFLFLPKDKESAELICRYEEDLLNSVPVYKLINKGDKESAAMTHDILSKKGKP